MNFLQQIYPGDQLASFLLRVLAEITLVTGVALVFGRIAARRNPALRHGVCLCALMCVLVAPITTVGLQRVGWKTLQISLESDGNKLTNRQGVAQQRVGVPPMKTMPFWTLERAREAASAILFVWICGTGFLIFRLIRGLKKVRKIRLTSFSVENSKLEDALTWLQSRQGMPVVPVRFSSRLNSPIVVGPYRTTVILPAKLLDRLTDLQLRCVLAHELNHVRQRDPLVGLIQRIVEAGYWPHPFVHLLNRDLIRAREEVCDNVALHGTTAPLYADTLLTVALGIAPRSATPGAIGLMTPPWKLEERVRGLLDPERRLTTTMNNRHLAFMVIALASGIALIAGAKIVAAPNPPTLQEVVELHSTYNPKTHSVVVTATSHPKATTNSPKTVRLSLRKTSAKVVFSHLTKDAKVVKAVDNGHWDILPKGTKIQVVTADPLKVHADLAKPSQSADVFISKASVRAEKSAETVQVKSEPTIVSTAGDTLTLSPAPVKLADSVVTVTTTVPLTYSVPVNPVVSTSPPSNQSSASTLENKSGGDAGKGRVLGDVPLIGRLFEVHDFQGVISKAKIDEKTADSQKANQLYIVQGGKPRIEWKPENLFKSQQQVQIRTTPQFKLDRKVFDQNVWALAQPQVHESTTIYIDGGDVKIVGDHIRIVYLKPDSAKTKTPQKAGGNKPKSRG